MVRLPYEMKDAVGRLYQLDLFRFLAALSIVCFHLGFRGWSQGGFQEMRFEEIASFAKYGYFGVHLFFIISGYVISMSIDGRSALEFAAYRVLRLYPAYWLALIVTTFVVAVFHQHHLAVHTKTLLINFTMLQSFLGFEDVDGVYWTLHFELQFYALVFLLALCRGIKFYTIFLALWMMLSFALSYFVPSHLLTDIFFPEWSGYFIMGSCFYLLHRKKANPLILNAILFASLSYNLLLLPKKAEELSNYYHYLFSPQVCIGIILMYFAAFWLLSNNKLSRLNCPGFLALGAMTYPLYLLHHNIGFSIVNTLIPEENKYFWLCLLIVYLLIQAWAVHQFVEKPVNRFLKPKILNAFSNR